MPHAKRGVLLDPFSGSGSALFAASAEGWQTKGIELLPVGNFATNMRFAADRVNTHEFGAAVANILQIENFAAYYDPSNAIKHIAITNGAFPEQEEEQLVGYISYCKNHILNEDIRELLLYGGFCILEEISYTRKDGQYLRWDARSGRAAGRTQFNKGKIYTFREAIGNKLQQILSDLEGTNIVQGALFSEESSTKTPKADAMPSCV